ncbi:MAG: hypothetical protein RMY16_12655 [Nostoc sp. DedQUE12b]|uniref:hypothetical protein n=1 Tax=Nostoc sp. DedQUE12b TaxID=3075398 RepID=UPI002AD1FB2A|nr:hypothetical protein [Nostoc sp. DedQUE12b]MDZ8086394.1 hypothetical protein [Nostoc sp. DedQUE12b]
MDLTKPHCSHYDVTIAVEPINEKFSRAIERAVSTDAAYGLTEYNGLVYALTDLSTGLFTFNTDPTAIGLEGFPEGFIEFSGSGANKVSGTATATALIDFVNLRGSGSGSLIITGGEGIFTGATGILDFFENDTISPNPNDPIRGQSAIGSFPSLTPYSRSIKPNNFSSTSFKYGRFNSPRYFNIALGASSKFLLSRSLLMRSQITYIC